MSNLYAFKYAPGDVLVYKDTCILIRQCVVDDEGKKYVYRMFSGTSEMVAAHLIESAYLKVGSVAEGAA